MKKISITLTILVLVYFSYINCISVIIIRHNIYEYSGGYFMGDQISFKTNSSYRIDFMRRVYRKNVLIGKVVSLNLFKNDLIIEGVDTNKCSHYYNLKELYGKYSPFKWW